MTKSAAATVAILSTLATLAIPFHARAECSNTAADADPNTQDIAAKLGVSAYDPIYLIVGGDGGFNGKFQISFKYKIFRAGGWFSDCLNVPSHIYLSYTQTSISSINEGSSPFKDTSYRPRLFYARDGVWTADNNKWRLDLEAGLAHESNGKAEPDSRAINAAYLRPTLAYNFNKGSRLYVAPMVVSYLDVLENPDIADYRGHVDLLIGYGSGNNGDHNWNLWTVLRKGDKSNYGSVEANLAIPFRFLTRERLNGWLLTQYFTGWGESLLDYDKKLTSQLRVGFAILVQ